MPVHLNMLAQTAFCKEHVLSLVMDFAVDLLYVIFRVLWVILQKLLHRRPGVVAVLIPVVNLVVAVITIGHILTVDAQRKEIWLRYYPIILPPNFASQVL